MPLDRSATKVSTSKSVLGHPKEKVGIQPTTTFYTAISNGCTEKNVNIPTGEKTEVEHGGAGEGGIGVCS